MYIAQGSYLFEEFCRHGPLLFTPSGAETVFGSKEYLPDHPPLGRFFLIVAHEGASWLISGRAVRVTPRHKKGSSHSSGEIPGEPATPEQGHPLPSKSIVSQGMPLSRGGLRQRLSHPLRPTYSLVQRRRESACGTCLVHAPPWGALGHSRTRKARFRSLPRRATCDGPRSHFPGLH